MPLKIAFASFLDCLVIGQAIKHLMAHCRKWFFRSVSFLNSAVYIGKNISGKPAGSIVFFPVRTGYLSCGLAGIVARLPAASASCSIDTGRLEKLVDRIEASGLAHHRENGLSVSQAYIDGLEHTAALIQEIRSFKTSNHFCEIYTSSSIQEKIRKQAERLYRIIVDEERHLSEQMGYLGTADVDLIFRRIEELKDAHWCLQVDLLDNAGKIKDLLGRSDKTPDPRVIRVYKEINAVLNSLDRLEVRGRDSAGISLLFFMNRSDFERFQKILNDRQLSDPFRRRLEQTPLLNATLTIGKTEDLSTEDQVAVAVTYKVAAEIGNLGDNIAFLRSEIRNDEILHLLTAFPHTHYTILSHTRWASVGAITEANCHPIDNDANRRLKDQKGLIHVCLNGDIDNYHELKASLEPHGNQIQFNNSVTTDTLIIPLQTEWYLKKGNDILEAFRLAVNDFKGSHAISMHTDLAPGKLFLAQKGSGQTIFIGLAEDHYMPTSEVYGFVEETPFFIKMDGEKIIEGKNGPTQGQIFILDQKACGGLSGITAMFYDGTRIDLQEKDIRQTEITSRDIDRQGFAHYFLKEISESPVSVEKTLQNRWKIKEDDAVRRVILLDERAFPDRLRTAWAADRIRRVFFVGQGTAGVAGLACANILSYYLDDPSILISALKASELSGFQLHKSNRPDAMSDCLVIAITQSGTTTDTNRTIDMAKAQGAHTLAIVNRRDSDITFKVDGVIYTSSGRDIEMSVASTKAFYAQIVAGAILGLFMAVLKKRRGDEFVSSEIQELLEIPSYMRNILEMRDKIAASAKRLALTKAHWAAVGSGPNKAAADEIRIKLSELCYKTISSDFVEDKKHIDLSSEPLIIVCAAGVRDTVIGDIIKDTAIFHAHKATPVVIANEGENRFSPYAADVFHVPFVSEHFAPILNALVGHIWGYYAALAINEGSSFLYGFRKDIQKTIVETTQSGGSLYELILEKSFRETIVRFYENFRRKKSSNRLPIAMGLEAVSDMTLLLKYLAGKLPIPDFELDFGKKGTALNMLDTLFECIGEAINCLSRPIDAIKHQAKTVTVGTSRIREKLEGILFEALESHQINISRVINKNIIVLRNLQRVVSKINGSILYKIDNLTLLGEPTESTKIEIIKKTGMLTSIPSRVEVDNQLKGTKRIIVREGNVYIGKGRKDDRSILIIPAISDSPSTPNCIELLLLLNISFKEDVPLADKIRALGGKYERIKNIVQESIVIWDDSYLEMVEIEELFGRSSEKIAEFIVSHRTGETA